MTWSFAFVRKRFAEDWLRCSRAWGALSAASNTDNAAAEQQAKDLLQQNYGGTGLNSCNLRAGKMTKIKSEKETSPISFQHAAFPPAFLTFYQHVLV